MADLTNMYSSDDKAAGSFELIPNGEYTAMITESSMRETKAGTGKYLALTLVITSGQYEGRRLWHNLNLDNPSEKAVEIARGQFAAIRIATGVDAPKDSSELHDIEMAIKVKIGKDGERNEIVSFSPKSDRGASGSVMPADKPWLQRPGS